MVEQTTTEEIKDNSIVICPTACDIVVAFLKSHKTDRENFLGAYPGGKYARGASVYTATQKAFSQYGKGEGDVPIRASDKGKIVAYEDQNGGLVLTKSCVTHGHYNVVQARKPEFVAGIAETLPYEVIQGKLVIEAQEIPELLKNFILANHKPESAKLPTSYKREYMNFSLSIIDRLYKTKRVDPMLPVGELAYMNCKACTSIILRTAVREEENGKKTVIKQSELKEEIVAGAENYLYALMKQDLEEEIKKIVPQKSKLAQKVEEILGPEPESE